MLLVTRWHNKNQIVRYNYSIPRAGCSCKHNDLWPDGPDAVGEGRRGDCLRSPKEREHQQRDSQRMIAPIPTSSTDCSGSVPSKTSIVRPTTSGPCSSRSPGITATYGIRPRRPSKRSLPTTSNVAYLKVGISTATARPDETTIPQRCKQLKLWKASAL